MLKYELGPLTIIKSGKKKKTAGVLYILNFFPITHSDNKEVVPHLIYVFICLYYMFCISVRLFVANNLALPMEITALTSDTILYK